MARGQQKVQAQQKNAEKRAKAKKAGAGNQKDAAAAAMKVACQFCKAPMQNEKVLQIHIDAKHEKQVKAAAKAAAAAK